MAKITKSTHNDSRVLHELADGIRNVAISAEGAQYFKNENLDKAINLSTEAFNALPEYERNQAVASFEGVADMLTSEELFGNKDVLHAIGVESVDAIPAHSLEAAKILVAASGNLQGYNLGQLGDKADKDYHQMSMESLYDGPFGALNVAPSNKNIATESFDEKELDKYLNYSIIYNVLASKQDEFNELFFRPLSVTPDEVGYRVSVRVEEVWYGNTHNPNGDVSKIVKRKMIDALVHPEILEANGTEVVPYFQEGSIDSTSHFVDSALIAPTVKYVENVAVKTAPLKINAEHSLIGLSSHPALIANGLMDNKDSLDGRLAIQNVYVKFGNKVVKFNTELLSRSGFYKSVEGNMREMSLTFDNGSFQAAAAVKAIDESEVAVFKALTDAKYDVRLNIRLHGKATVEHGYVEVSALPLRVSSVSKEGQSVPFSEADLVNNAELKALLINLLKDAEIIGYDVEARRTNFNLRTSGKMIDSTEYREQITIPLRSPISIIKPVVGGEKEYPDIKALVSATRIMANNDGVKTVLNHGRLMQQIISRDSYTWETDRDAFPGIGRHFLQPCYIQAKLHLPDLINSVSSENRLKDIQGAISTKLNEIIGRVLKDTNYIPVVEQMTGGNVGKIEVIIGTDYRLPQYLAIQGDTRLFGGKIDYRIGSTANRHMSNKIVMSLSRVLSEEGPDPFSYGTFVWTPELVVSTTMDRGASTYHLHLVQPRYLHIVNIPILVEVDITGIEEVTGEATVLNVSQTTKEEGAKYYNGSFATNAQGEVISNPDLVQTPYGAVVAAQDVKFVAGEAKKAAEARAKAQAAATAPATGGAGTGAPATGGNTGTGGQGGRPGQP